MWCSLIDLADLSLPCDQFGIYYALGIAEASVVKFEHNVSPWLKYNSEN